jgi:hypothetical protein
LLTMLVMPGCGAICLSPAHPQLTVKTTVPT